MFVCVSGCVGVNEWEDKHCLYCYNFLIGLEVESNSKMHGDEWVCNGRESTPSLAPDLFHNNNPNTPFTKENSLLQSQTKQKDVAYSIQKGYCQNNKNK